MTEPRPLRPVFVCQALDEADPVHAGFVQWVRALSNRSDIDTVTVLTLRAGRYDLCSNVTVRDLGRNRLERVVRFYGGAIGALVRRRADFFFIAQGGPYPILLLPLRVVARVPVYQWKAHPHVSTKMRFIARWCDDLIFTSTPGAFPVTDERVRRKVKVVGQAIDVARFPFADRATDGVFAVIGRVAPSKRLDQVVAAMAEARRCGSAARLDVIGPTLQQDEPYRDELQRLISDRALDTAVTLCGSVEQSELPARLTHYRAVLNFSNTALDRSAVEAMACGVPVLTTNECLAEILPDGLRKQLTAEPDDLAGQVALIHQAEAWSGAERADLGRQLRQLVEDEHSLGRMWDEVLGHIRVQRGGRR